MKRGSKQFRRSLRTKDLTLAKQHLRAFQNKVSQLSKQADKRNLLLKELSDRWLLAKEPHFKASSFDRLKVALKGLLPYLGAHAVRSTDSSHLAN